MFLTILGLLFQHVAEPTHSAGHTLDLVITKSDTSISALRVGDMISDHALPLQWGLGKYYVGPAGPVGAVSQ